MSSKMIEESRQQPPDPTVETDDTRTSAPALNGFFANGLDQSTAETDSAAEKISQTSTETAGCSTSDLFEILSNQRRRYVVYYLKQTDEPIKIGLLSTQLAAWENECERAQVTGDERKRVYTSLQQVHLPKMDKSGILSFDKQSGVITPTAELKQIALDIDTTTDDRVPWHKYYTGYAVVCAGIVIAATAGLWPVAAVPNSVWLIAIAITLLLSAATQTYLSTNRAATEASS